MTYAAYLRTYEPGVAFHEPDRSRWAAYAAIDGVAKDERELAVATYTRTQPVARVRRIRDGELSTELARQILSRALFPNPARCDDKYR